MGLVLIGSIVLAFLYLVFGFFNIIMNKNSNLLFMRVLSIIEICFACLFGFILFLPSFIISIVRLCILNKLQ